MSDGQPSHSQFSQQPPHSHSVALSIDFRHASKCLSWFVPFDAPEPSRMSQSRMVEKYQNFAGIEGIHFRKEIVLIPLSKMDDKYVRLFKSAY